VVFDRSTPSDRISDQAIPKPEKASAKEFAPAAEELFEHHAVDGQRWGQR
jgi:hypothetical protein